MLEQKYKLPKSSYKFDAPFLGFALCCNEKPKVDFDSSKENAKYYVGHMACPVCDNQLGVIANADGGLPDRVGFLYKCWNLELPNNKLFNMPEGFSWYESRITHQWYGGQITRCKYFLVLKIEDKKVYNYCLYRNKIIEMEFPKGNSCYFDLNEWVSGGNKKWNAINFYTRSNKWKKKLEEFLVVNLDSGH
jgi:hypothetical protein